VRRAEAARVVRRLSARRRGLRGNRPLQAIAAGWAAVWIATAIAPKYPSDWLLENLLVFAFVPALVATHRRFPFSNASYLLIAVFLSLHAYGAHYTYSEAPLGFWLRDTFGLSRNHYDRIVHFGFGVLLAPPLRELAVRALGLRRAWSYVFPFACALSLSASYEIVESWVARIADPELGTAYLGTQGDEWDAQKDMALAMLGAALGLGLTFAAERARRSR
jgi:putative membrane protein